MFRGENQDDSDFFHGYHMLTLAIKPFLDIENAGLAVPAGRGIHPTRTIPTWELIVVRSGTLEMFEDDRTFSIGPGGYLLLRPGHRHGGSAPFRSGLSFYWVHFHLRRHRGGDRLVVPQCGYPRRVDHVIELFRRLLDEQEGNWCVPHVGELLLAQCFCELACGDADPEQNPGSQLAWHARKCIAEQYDDPALSTAVIAAELQCNSDYLGRLYQRTFGCSIVAAIRQLRLRRARRLLMDSAMTIEQIARSCGYRQGDYFRRVFHQAAGQSPRAFRNLYARFHVNTE